MATEYCRKSGQIPAFGDWETANQLPITQYFECARQAGLLRCSCSGECCASWGGAAAAAAGDLYGTVGFDKPLPRRVYAVPQRKTSGINKGYSQSKEQRKQVKVRDLMEQPRTRPSSQKLQYSKQSTKSVNLVQQKSSITVKPVDEDLYKIPSELLENSKRKKMLGFFSRCMVPPCAA
ncbi:uncharacterized protein LOC105161168 isoform X2 [Sesamum indicum]|uniref:Uncharacterized protein LOC105161168 isoform X2 n=1 Tax=Sesamum indicum TaxID=4182 RepID=A0A6I9T4N5_SESIN|nr:uncharacterized protein LOC105161168 isoform X2 [Sesamum indicum]